MKLKRGLVSTLFGGLGELIAYFYLLRENEKESNIKFVIPWSCGLINLYYHRHRDISAPYQLIQMLKSLKYGIALDPDNFAISFFDLIGYSCKLLKKDFPEIESRYNPEAYGDKGIKSIWERPGMYGCEAINCPILFQKFQEIFYDQLKDIEFPEQSAQPKSYEVSDSTKSYRVTVGVRTLESEIQRLISEYNKPRPRHYNELSEDEKRLFKKRHPSAQHPEKRRNIMISDELSDSFNRVIIDHKLNCEHLDSIQLIEVKAITSSNRVSFTEKEIAALRYIHSKEFDINLTYQVLGVDINHLSQNEFNIYYLDNQKIIEASQNKKRLTRSYLKLLKTYQV